jgi:hypothetical protein
MTVGLRLRLCEGSLLDQDGKFDSALMVIPRKRQVG